MPANPSNPFPLGDLQDLLKGLQKGPTGWWNNVQHDLLEWPSAEFAAASTGLFFQSAATNKTLHHFDYHNLPIRLPEDCPDILSETKRLIGEMEKEIDAIKELSCIQKYEGFKDNGDKSIVYKLYSNEESICSFSVTKGTNNTRGVELDVKSFDYKLIDKLRKISEKYIALQTKAPKLFAVSEDDEGKLILSSLGKPGIELERDNYSEEVLYGFDYIVEQLNAKSPFGRLVIMYGPPGTGKTHLLRGLFNALNSDKRKFIFLQPEFLFKHSVASLTRLLLDATEDGNSIVLLVEDADDCLIKRQADNMVGISTLLNLADGFIGNMLDIRIIATTNASQLEIDPALKRPGRLCRIIEAGLLNPAQANAIVKKITGKDGSFTSSVSLADVYAKVALSQGRIADVGKLPTASSTGVGFGRK